MKKIIKNNLINVGLLTYYELLFALLMFDTYSKNTIISSFIYILFSSFIITVLTNLFSEKLKLFTVGPLHLRSGLM